MKMHLKLTYRKVASQNFSGGYTPGPPLQGEVTEGRKKGGDPYFETVSPPL